MSFFKNYQKFEKLSELFKTYKNVCKLGEMLTNIEKQEFEEIFMNLKKMFTNIIDVHGLKKTKKRRKKNEEGKRKTKQKQTEKETKRGRKNRKANRKRVKR